MRTLHRSRRRVFALLGVVALAWVLGLSGGDRAVADEPEVEIALTEETPIEELLKSVGQITKFPIVWDPQDKAIRGKQIISSVTFKAPKRQLFEMVRALLTFFDLVMVPVGPAGYEVNLVMDARQTQSILKLKPKYIDLTPENLSSYETADGLFVTTTIKVENMRDLRDARNALVRIVTGQNIGNVQEVPDARSFVVTDFAPNVVAIYRLLKTMDVRPEGKRVTSEFIPLKYATSDEVEPILTDLFTGRQRVTQVPRPPGPQGGGGADLLEEIEPRIISDPRTNMIIVYATGEDIQEIKAVLERLDVPIFITRDRVHVIRLKNLEAVDTAEVLRSLIDATSLFGTSTGVSGGAGRQTRPGRAPAGQPVAGGEVLPEEEQKPAVVAEEASNSLVIAATERQFKEIQKIVNMIDVPKNQVLIEAALVELTLSDAFTLAFELGLGDDKALVTGQGVSGGAFTTYGLSEFVDVDGDTFFTDRLPNFISAGGAAPTGLVGGIFAFGQVPLLFNILNSTSQSRILQLPSITVADNKEAQIKVSELQATTTTSTTGTGIQTGGFEGFEEAGTTLTISPHIADDFNLLLDIKLEVSAFVGNPRVVGGAVVPADKLQREMFTQVSLPDRHTVVLGGLLGQNQRSTVDKTPVLADIPVLGHLFKSSTKNDRQTSLFLFVTPTILPGREDSIGLLDELTCKRKQKADELIGYTEIFGSNFVGCESQDPSTGCIKGSGSASDRLDRLGAFEATRFSGVSEERLQRERSARLDALQRKPAANGAAPRALPARASVPAYPSAAPGAGASEGAPPRVGR